MKYGLFETKTWLLKSYQRDLLKEQLFLELTDKLEHTNALLNNLIKSLRS